MTSAIGIPTNRVSDAFVYKRLTSQVQSDQLALFRYQSQLSTGLRFQLPSDDPVASLQVMSLESLIQRKQQVQTNVSTNQSFLNSTDGAMSTISKIVASARGTALGVMGTTATDDQRKAAAQQIQQAILQLMDTGNQQLRGRYLFAGSETQVQPFSFAGDNVIRYAGNDGELQSYSDLNLLFQTNVPGNQVFSALSEAVRGSVDLDPILTFDTPLSQLNGGKGVSKGSLVLSDGTHSSVVDISSASTIGDVATLLRQHAPATQALNVEVTAHGLVLQLDPNVAAGNLSIREVGAGTTARDLGILHPTGVGNNPLVGSPLNPSLVRTTPLGNVLGTRAQAAVRSGGIDNDFIITGESPGTALNGATIVMLDDPTVIAGHETVDDYDPATKQIVVHVSQYHTVANQVVAAINAKHLAGNLPFTATLDPLDTVNGNGLVAVTPVGQVAATTAGGEGQPLDKTSGLQIVNGGNTYTIDISQAQTVEDVLNLLNGSPAGVLASINQDATGIDVRSRLSGADFAVGENGGTTAAQLGLRTLNADTRLEGMNYGRGVNNYTGTGTMASAVYHSPASDSGLELIARNTGSQWNDYQVQFVDNGGAPGSESVTYDQVNRAIVFSIVPGSTTANDLLRVFQHGNVSQDFQLALDLNQGANLGTGLVAVGATATANGSSDGADFTITRADGAILDVDLQGATDIQDVLDRINHHPNNPPLTPGGDSALVARLNAYGNGIELIDNSVGPGKLAVSKSPMSNAAIDLGLVPAGQIRVESSAAGTQAAASVVSAGPNNDLIFTSSRSDTYGNGWKVVFQDSGPGSESFTYDTTNRVMTFEIDAGTTDANRIRQLFAGNAQAAADFSVSLDPADGSPNDGTGMVAVTGSPPPTLSGGVDQRLTGSDTNPQEVDGLFTAMLRLQNALAADDMREASRAIDMLDGSVLKANFSHSELGARQQGLDAIGQRLSAENVELNASLSDNRDADLAEVISNLTARQTALQASLQSAGQIFKLTLLDYL